MLEIPSNLVSDAGRISRHISKYSAVVIQWCLDAYGSHLRLKYANTTECKIFLLVCVVILLLYQEIATLMAEGPWRDYQLPWEEFLLLVLCSLVWKFCRAIKKVTTDHREFRQIKPSEIIYGSCHIIWSIRNLSSY